MKLATFTDGKTNRIGAVRDDGIVDLSAIAPDMVALISSEAAMAKARAAAETGKALPLDSVTLCAPVPFPGKVLAIGLNYADHVEESGQPMPEHQVWFNKQHNCITGPYADVALPSVSSLLDYEAEMCFVIGKRCKHVPKERAHEVIAGYFVGNDVSVRDWQLRTNTWQTARASIRMAPSARGS